MTDIFGMGSIRVAFVEAMWGRGSDGSEPAVNKIEPRCGLMVREEVMGMGGGLCGEPPKM